jgi:hypothetical protein
VSRGGTHRCQLTVGTSYGFPATSLAQSTANPFRHRHVVAAGNLSNLAQLSLVQQHLETLTHIMSMTDFKI